MSDFLTALPIGLLLIFSAGPVFFVILETSITNGAKQALAVSLGAVLADIGLIAIAFLVHPQYYKNSKTNPNCILLVGQFYFLMAFYLLLKQAKQKSKSTITQKRSLHKRAYFFI